MLSAVLATAILSVFRSVIRRYCGKTIGCRLMLSSLLGSRGRYKHYKMHRHIRKGGGETV